MDLQKIIFSKERALILLLFIAVILSFGIISKIRLGFTDEHILLDQGLKLINRGVVPSGYASKEGIFIPPVPFFLFFGYTQFALRLAQSSFLFLTVFNLFIYKENL